MPRLVFWNLCGRSDTIPMVDNENGLCLLSGFSQNAAKVAAKKEIKDFIFRNPIFCLVAVFVLIYALIRIFKGDFAGIDIIFNALILYCVYRITNKKPKEQ